MVLGIELVLNTYWLLSNPFSHFLSQRHRQVGVILSFYEEGNGSRKRLDQIC